MVAAGQDGSESARRLRQWQETQRDFLEQTGLKRQAEREYVGGWGRSEAAAQSRQSPLTNAAGQRILPVKKTDICGPSNGITQVVNKKDGLDRNYYDADGRQTKQISNNGHGHKKEEALGLHGEHAHDYRFDENGKLLGRPVREITNKERKENGDIL